MAEARDFDPLSTFLAWHREAKEKGSPDPDAMTLATATKSGRPSARVVLFKGIDGGDLEFVTNYGSRKAAEIDENPEVALVFYWPELARQVRFEGAARRASAAESDAYFRSRPRRSQLAAWASQQSQVVASRAELEQRFAEVERRFQDLDVERPPGWGLYRVALRTIELWISGPDRMHDRFVYTASGAGWQSQRLCP
jgi:pyridoxamine 5'-phosphate oxidase